MASYTFWLPQAVRSWCMPPPDSNSYHSPRSEPSRHWSSRACVNILRPDHTLSAPCWRFPASCRSDGCPPSVLPLASKAFNAPDNQSFHQLHPLGDLRVYHSAACQHAFIIRQQTPAVTIFLCVFHASSTAVSVLPVPTGQLRSTMRASCGINSDLAYRTGIFRRRHCRCLLLWCRVSPQLIDEFYQTEDYKCRDQEVDNAVIKLPHITGAVSPLPSFTYKFQKSVPPEDCQNRD